jgi:hypothetical protein
MKKKIGFFTLFFCFGHTSYPGKMAKQTPELPSKAQKNVTYIAKCMSKKLLASICISAQTAGGRGKMILQKCKLLPQIRG